MMTNSISPVVRLVDDDYTVLDALTVFLEMADMTDAPLFERSGLSR